MKIFILLILISFNAGAYETSILVPLYTVHTKNTDYNNTNRGIGLEIKFGSSSYSVVAVDKNSYNRNAVYLSAGYRKAVTRNLSITAGGTIATGYDEYSTSGVHVFPVFSVQWYSMRVSTTYPVSELFCTESGTQQRCSDVVSVQYVRGF